MKKKVLLTHPYFLELDPKQASAGLPYPPLGTLYAAALLRASGYAVTLFDSMFALGPDALRPFLGQQPPDVMVIYADGFNYLTKMCLTNMREATFHMIRLASEKGCTVIISSSDSTDHLSAYLEQGADVIINGEAEQTLLELMDALSEDKDDWSGIKGLAFMANGVVKKTNSRPLMKDWESLPAPAFDLIDMDLYRGMWYKHAGTFSLNMATTRGCPFHCNWCAKPIYGNRYTARSAEHVVQELVLMKAQYGMDHIWFCDDIFGLKPGWVKSFADELERQGLSIRFKIQCRADLLLQEDNIRDLARAGCDSVWMGAESGSQKILDAMDKGTTVEQIQRATFLLKEHGIKPCFFIQFGYPGETKEDIGLTIDLIRTLLPDDIGISVSYPLPGTGFYEKVKNSLGDKSNWTDSNELALIFRHAYPPAFYKQLYRYVHRTYRQDLALQHLASLWKHPALLSGTVLKKAASILYYIPAAYWAKIKLNQIEATTG